jgi:putative ABC transport system substrate-binding protein
MNRREFVALLGGAPAVLPFNAHAQQSARLKHIGVLTHLAETDTEMQGWLTALRERLGQMGWQEQRNVRVTSRFAAGRAEQLPALAKELVGLQPDVIVTHAPPSTEALKHETQTIPIVFVAVSDPVGQGFVASLARPGGNLTGMLSFERGIVGKWLSMLKEIAPALQRVAVMANPKTTNFDYFLSAAETSATAFKIEVMASRVETPGDIERAVGSLAATPNSGLLLAPDGTVNRHHRLIAEVAARHQLPTVFPFRFHVAAGGLMSYGVDQTDMYRQAATFVDRILRGEAAANLPVQLPTKYTTVVNLKTAKTIGLTMPPAMLVAADEVIE